MISPVHSTSTRPYLIRALYEWCTDNGFTPYVAVLVDETVKVPREYVNNGEIVLNISFDATSNLNLSNDFIEFKARFAGVARDIMVPMGRVIAIYARENGQGMSFPVVDGSQPQAATSTTPNSTEIPPGQTRPHHGLSLARSEPQQQNHEEKDPPPTSPSTKRPKLKRVK